MNWYPGNISKAISLSKQKNAIFVVYVEGNDELSIKMRGFVNDERVRNYLESDHFVAIRIESGSESYMLFAQIYKLVPLPSLFFIDKHGTPLEIATGIIQSCDELVKKIEKVLETSTFASVSEPAAAVTSNFIAEEQLASTSLPTNNPNIQSPTTVNVPSITENNQEHESREHALQIERAQKIIEAKNKEKEEVEKRLAREREIERRKTGQSIQSFKEKQKEDELQKLKEERIRDRLADQVARQQILEKIASDRAERAYKNVSHNDVSNVDNTKKNECQIPKAQTNSDSTRIQFRTPDGLTHTQSFDNKTQFLTIRNYVATTVLKGEIIDFQLATTFPKRIFTTENDSTSLLDLGLAPSTLILIFCTLKNNSATSSVAQKSGQVLTFFQSVLMYALYPIFTIYEYLGRFIFGTGGNNGTSSEQQSTQNQSNKEMIGVQKRLSEDAVTPNDSAKKRNMNRLITDNNINEGASTSNDLKSDSVGKAYKRSNVHRLTDLRDSDDDNATWNGNSTQQQ